MLALRASRLLRLKRLPSSSILDIHAVRPPLLTIVLRISGDRRGDYGRAAGVAFG